VEAGEKIGTVFTANGQSTLHFEVWHVQGNSHSPQDPNQWLVRH
jgi:murein DD-endopeptidase MepM/ murein hydrolase activator NlpD